MIFFRFLIQYVKLFQTIYTLLVFYPRKTVFTISKTYFKGFRVILINLDILNSKYKLFASNSDS